MWLLGKTWSRFSSRGDIVVKNVKAGRSIHRKCTPEPAHFADEKEKTHKGRGSAPAPPHIIRRADGGPGAPSPAAFSACLLTALSLGAGRGRVERARRRCPQTAGSVPHHLCASVKPGNVRNIIQHFENSQQYDGPEAGTQRLSTGSFPEDLLESDR